MFRQFIIIGLSLACFAQVAHFMPSSAVARDVPEGETDTAGAAGGAQNAVMGAVNDAKEVGTLVTDQIIKSINQVLIANARALTAFGGLLGSTTNGVTKGTSSVFNGLAGGFKYLDNVVKPLPIINTLSSGISQTLDVSANTLATVTDHNSKETNKMFKTLRDAVDKAIPAGLSSASSTQGASGTAEAAPAA
ncbi:uncharacterized protein LOC126847766 [Adelges cooleyi]|uniref:uncharacterized protein LOC126847766 n=1 Tax=Adelges cooleyi TaxID=133065 RepID=UPI0021804ED4|nr:uncharacterized protein LOC126847766 [Adelges cooleyi]